jgi:septum site-determining protein MinC
MEALSKSGVAEATRAATRSRAAFELKGVVTPLTVMRLRTTDLNLIERQLRAKLLQMPQFFQDAPVVLDLGELAGQLHELPLPSLAHVLRSMRVVPVGVSGAPEGARDLIRAAGLTQVQVGGSGQPIQPPRPPEEAPAAPAAVAAARPPEPPTPRPERHRPPVVVRQPVRGGQEIYARQTDLIVLAPVNPGAQLYADGHIHIYATLRGRAMAGAQGLTDARIFVQKLEAELVAVAGAYVMADDIPLDRRGRPSQVYLERGECRISAI